MTALLYGVVAAVGWGFADYLAALAARRVGTFKTTLGSQALSLPLLAAALAASGNFPALTPAVLGAAILQGTLGAVALAALYRGLAIGPIAIVSPIVAAYAALTVVLAVVVLNETLTPLQAAAMAATLLGVILASTDLRAVRETLGRPPGLPRGRTVSDTAAQLFGGEGGRVGAGAPGVALALVSMVSFGVLSFLLAAFTRALGLFATVLFGRVALTASLLLAATVRRELLGGLRAPMLALLVFVGLLDLAATLSFGLGSLAGYASIVAIGASAYPLIPMVFGLGLLRERVAPNQLAGAVLLIAGLATLGAAG